MKIRNQITLIAAVFIMLAQVQITIAQTAAKALDSWELLGSHVVDYTLDRDVIALKEPSNQSITGLKFVVKTGTLNMHKATVHFTNGDTQVVDFPPEVNKTNDGRIMDLKGNTRKIEKITFWYDTVNKSKDKSVVEVWGK